MPTSARSKARKTTPHSPTASKQPSSSYTVPALAPTSATTFLEQLQSEAPMSSPIQDGTQSASSSETVQGFQSVGEYMQELMDTMRRLEQLGVERSNIPVPRIVVTGDQSAGKSSFIEAISQISVPRNAGTCTRCPVQITTSSSDSPWRCIVRLVKKYDYYDHEFLATRADCYAPGIFHPWQESSETKIIPFADLIDQTMVCDTIEKAQAAILHPSQDPTKFQTGPLPPSGQAEVKFSPNYISLEISGRNLPNLSFYDLPGIISRTRDPKEGYLVGLVENLVREYIREESAIVLLAIALEQDQEHSRTSQLIEETGAKSRCVGVLTKPDRLADGTPAMGLDKILSGHDFPLGHGYYVTKQPDQTQRSLTHSEARSMENLFFTRQAPWSTELSHHQALFGTKKIQEALSKLLFGQITALLPQIREKLAAKLQLIGEELTTLPEVPTAEVIHIVSSCLSSFNEQVHAFIRGRYPNNGFRSSWREEKEAFQKRIQALRPRVQLNMLRDSIDTARLLKSSPIKSKSIDVMDLTEDSDVGTPAPTHTPVTPTKRKNEDPFSTATTPAMKKLNLSSEDGIGHIYTVFHLLTTALGPEVYSLDQIRAFLDGYSAVGLRGSYDPEAVEELILKSLKWEQPAKDFLAAVFRQLHQVLTVTMKKCLHGYDKTPLFQTLERSVKDFLTTRIEQYQQHADMLLKYERHQPSTLYDDALDRARITAIEELREARFRVRARRFLAMQAETSKKEYVLEQLLGNPKDRLALQTALGHDTAAREIDVMSQVRGYYRVASMRYADNLYRVLEVEVFESLKTELKQHLEQDILYCEPNVQDRCAELLAEDPARERRRVQLKQEKEHLQAASQMLDDLAEKYGVDGIDSTMNEELY